MKLTWILLLTGTLVMTGCVSKARHRLEVREAFLAGQQQAMAQMKPTSKTDVTIRGNVKNSFVPWKENMSLAEAIYQAEYLDKNRNPKVIILRRGSETMQISTRDLLNGNDVPVMPGDVIELVR